MRKIAALLLLMLSGCWIGADFYDAADLRRPLSAGDYQLTELTKGMVGDGRVRIAHRPDGYTTFTPIDAQGQEDRGDATTLGAAALDGEARLFVAWQVVREPGSGPNERIYALLRRESSGAFTLLFPRCEGREAEMARAAGAAIINQERMVPACTFSSRAQLEVALRTAAPLMQPVMRLTLLPR